MGLADVDWMGGGKNALLSGERSAGCKKTGFHVPVEFLIPSSARCGTRVNDSLGN
jgi:hypothetical protein